MLLEFIIVGAMKSGTSTLAHFLRQHPEIYMPDGEVHFFYEEGKGHWQDGIQWYRGQFQEALPEQVAGEKTPTYSYLPGVAERIHNVLPDVKLIWIFRDPIDRAYSNYWHAVRSGIEPLGFAEAVRREDDRDIWKGYVRRSQYAEQVSRYLDYFDREQMHFSLFEDLKAEPRSVLEELFQFLDVDPGYSDQLNQRARKNVTKIPRSTTFRYWTRSVLDEIPILRSLAFRLDRRFNQRSEPGYPDMDDGVQRHLENHFQPYNEKLQEKTGLDPTAWA